MLSTHHQSSDVVQIFVRMPSNQIVKLEVKLNDTIGHIKVKIEEKARIRCDHHELFFFARQLNDEQTLLECKTQKENSIYLTLRFVGPIEIFVKTLYGKTIPLQVKRDDTIRHVKEEIQSKEGFLIHQQLLVFGSRRLDNELTLFHYDIQRESTLHLILLPRQSFDIFIEPPKGKTIVLQVTSDDIIEKIKAKIQSTEAIPSGHLKLFFAGQLLEDKKTLSYYNIQHANTLRFTVRVPESVDILIKMISGRMIAIAVLPNDTSEIIKRKIQDKTGVPIEQQRLVFCGRELNNQWTLAAQNVRHGSALYMIHRLTRSTQILAETDPAKNAMVAIFWREMIQQVRAQIRAKAQTQQFNQTYLSDNTLFHNRLNVSSH